MTLLSFINALFRLSNQATSDLREPFINNTLFRINLVAMYACIQSHALDDPELTQCGASGGLYL